MHSSNLIAQIQQLTKNDLVQKNNEQTIAFNGTTYRFENLDAFLSWKLDILNDYIRENKR